MPNPGLRMSPVQFSLRTALLAMVLFAAISAGLSRLVHRLDEHERLRAAYLVGGFMLGALIGAGMAAFARARIERIAGKLLLVVPAKNSGIIAMKLGMAAIAVLWCAIIWVFTAFMPPQAALFSIAVAFPFRWLCRFPRYLELFENGIVYGGTVYFAWRRFRSFRFSGGTLDLALPLDRLDLNIPADYVKEVDTVLSQHIVRWEAETDQFNFQ